MESGDAGDRLCGQRESTAGVADTARGVAECLYLPAAIALIADHHAAETRATAIGIHTAGLSIGLVAGGWASGYLGAQFGWQVAFRTLGLLGVLLSVITCAWLRDGQTQRRSA